MKLNHIHHIAVICSDYEISKRFYTDVLGLNVGNEYYHKERNSYKTDCSLNGTYVIKLFSFPNLPLFWSRRTALPCFRRDNINKAIKDLDAKGVAYEPICTDEYTRKRFVFFCDPDGLPIEIYEK